CDSWGAGAGVAFCGAAASAQPSSANAIDSASANAASDDDFMDPPGAVERGPGKAHLGGSIGSGAAARAALRRTRATVSPGAPHSKPSIPRAASAERDGQ